MNHPNLADMFRCTGCLACADTCPMQAITCIINEEGHYSYKIDEDKCILCHKCETVCPIVSGREYGSNNLKLSQPYAVWNTNEEQRKVSTSGGVFPALSKYIIEQGGVVFGAKQEQFYVHHESIEEQRDIIRLQGSKYTQSKTIGIFEQVRRVLDSGRKVLFTGVGCQAAALVSFLSGNKNLDNLIVVDLICGGVPSSFLVNSFKNDMKVSAIVSYRTKTKYELTVIDEQGNSTILPPEARPLPLYGFTTGATERYICYDCPFAKGHRMSDITIGDFWGNSLFPEQVKKGVSVAIVHSKKGMMVLNQSELEVKEINWRDFLYKNPRLVYGKGNVPKSRYYLAKAFRTYDYERLLEEFANKGTWKRPISILNRMIRIIKGRVMAKKKEKVVENILEENSL